KIALKVDVDTFRGTREGVPALVRALERAGAGASFLFSLGPDHTGRAIRRALRPGFFGKVARTSVLEHYGLKTLMYGVLLPGPDIGRREADTLRAVARAGFECGVHTWDHVRWQDGVARAGVDWTRRELRRATERFAEVFGASPALHGAAGWQMNEAAYRIESELGYRIASDGRGPAPYQTVDAQGRPIGPPQFPTTLPTLDELIGLDGWTPDNVHRALLDATAAATTPQVYTLHAELEGQKLLPTFERLLAGWRAQGHELVSVRDLAAGFDAATLPRRRAGIGSVPGRSGTLAVPGELVHAGR
ncbi:MAG: polysaccharide deacetylase family protein, partial [Burkholderiales bacterium]|nr:polysaccharide deacetylase family protein [Burkholderiales bacterium]